MRMLVSNFLKALGYVISIFLTIFTFLFIVRLALAWAGPDYIFELIGFLTEAGVNFIGKILRLPTLKYDIRPIFAIAALLFLRFFAVKTLSDLSHKMEKME